MTQRQVVATIPTVLKKMVVAEKESQVEPKLKAVKTQMGKLKGFRRLIGFGFEKRQATKSLARLEKEKVHLEMASLGYPELDYSFLAWRKKGTKLPAFMVLDLKSDTFTLSVEAMDPGDDPWVSFTPDLPEAIKDQFWGSVRRLESLSRKTRGWDEIQITAEFQGVMPSEVREKTREASRHFGEVYLIVEAPGWKVDRIRSTKGDPLVVGWVKETEQMFLITAFDPTALEEYVQIQHII